MSVNLHFSKEVGRQQRRGRRKPLSAGAGVLFQEPVGVESCVRWGGGVKNNRNEVKSFFFHVALRPRRRDGLLGTGTEWEGDDRVKARPRKPPEKDRRDRGPPPEQWKC